MMTHISHRIHRLIKRISLGAALTSSILLLDACSSDTLVDAAAPEDVPTVQELVINLSTTGGNLTARAGRPLQSTNPDQGISHVTLYVLNSEGIVLQKQINKNAWANAWDYTNGKELLVSFRKSEGDFLPDGDYTLFALGFSEDTNYSLQPNPLLPINAINGETFNNSQIKKIQAADFQKEFSAALQKTGQAGEEIFAGKTTIKVAGGMISQEKPQSTSQPVVVLNRQVAGAMGYFINIPAKVNNFSPTQIRLVASNKNNQLHFNSLLEGETTSQINHVVNGSQKEPFNEEMVEYGCQIDLFGYTVYEILLADFFPLLKEAGKTLADCDLNQDGYVGIEDVKQAEQIPSIQNQFWVNPWNTAEHPQSLVKGAVYGAAFVLPFHWHENCPTFELQLLHRDETTGYETFLKTWNVRIAEKQLNQQTPSGNNSTGVIVPIEGDHSTSCFHVYRNHLYALGTKTKKGNGTALDQIEEDKEKPVDLSRYLDLVITIKKGWAQDVSMGIK